MDNILLLLALCHMSLRLVLHHLDGCGGLGCSILAFLLNLLRLLLLL